MRSLFLLVAAAIAIAGFQNCTGLSASPRSTEQSKSLPSHLSSNASESGNGGFYEGKPDQSFINIDTQGVCDPTSLTPATGAGRVKSAIQIIGTRAVQTVTDCKPHDPVDVTTRVDYMPHNTQVLFNRGRLFEARSVLESNKQVAQLVCRGNKIVRYSASGSTTAFPEGGFADFTMRPTDKTVRAKQETGPDAGQIVDKPVFEGEVAVGVYDATGKLTSSAMDAYQRAFEVGTFLPPINYATRGTKYVMDLRNSNYFADSYARHSEPFAFRIFDMVGGGETARLNFRLKTEPNLIEFHMKCFRH